MGGARAERGVDLLRGRPPLSPWREWRSSAGGSLAGILSRERAFHSTRSAETQYSNGEGLGVSGRRQWPPLPSRSWLVVVLRNQVAEDEIVFLAGGQLPPGFLLRGLQRGVVEIETIKNLVIVVARS